MPKNRVLSLAEVKALPEGTKVFVEINPAENFFGFFVSRIHQVKRNHIDKGHMFALCLIDSDSRFWPVSVDKPDPHLGTVYRVWEQTHRPTDADLAENPWPVAGDDDDESPESEVGE